MVAATVNCLEMDWNRNMEFFATGVFVSRLPEPYCRSNRSLPSWCYLASVERARRASRVHSASRTAAGVRQGANYAGAGGTVSYEFRGPDESGGLLYSSN